MALAKNILQGKRADLEFLRDQSASGAILNFATTSTNGRPWRIISILVTYSAAFTGTVSVKKDSGTGALYDETLPDMTFGAETEKVYRPAADQAIIYDGGDNLEVTCPLLATKTSQVEVVRELL